MREFFSPDTIAFGRGAAAQVGAITARYAKKCLVVTGARSSKATGSLDLVLNSLAEAGVESVVFAEAESDPSMETVHRGAALARESGAGAVLGLGGGSPLDAAKGVAVLAVNPGTVRDYVGREPDIFPLPVIAVPTTAGTGSEVTRVAVITDPERKVKMVIAGRGLIPRAAVLDPDLTATMPPHVAAGTGMDALTHAVEAYTSILATPMTDLLALEAIRLIGANLLPAVHATDRAVAGEAMLRGQMLAGLAFSNASVGLVHAMTRPLGAYHGIPHGHANAMLLARVMKHLIPAAPDRFAAIAEALGLAPGSGTPMERALAGADLVENLLLQTGLAIRLSDFGVTDAGLDALVEDAMGNASATVCARRPVKEDIRRLYLAALQQWYPGAVFGVFA